MNKTATSISLRTLVFFGLASAMLALISPSGDFSMIDRGSIDLRSMSMEVAIMCISTLLLYVVIMLPSAGLRQYAEIRMWELSDPELEKEAPAYRFACAKVLVPTISLAILTGAFGVAFLHTTNADEVHGIIATIAASATAYAVTYMYFERIDRFLHNMERRLPIFERYLRVHYKTLSLWYERLYMEVVCRKICEKLFGFIDLHYPNGMFFAAFYVGIVGLAMISFWYSTIASLFFLIGTFICGVQTLQTGWWIGLYINFHKIGLAATRPIIQLDMEHVLELTRARIARALARAEELGLLA